MVDGFWTAEFLGIPGLVGGGVVLLSKGKVYGGDSQYYYTGKYVENKDTLEAQISVNAFVAQPASVFGTNEQKFRLNLSGAIGPSLISANASREENPRMTMKLRLTRRSDLPA